MEGMDVMGTRETTTISRGVTGNDHSFSVTKEFWIHRGSDWTCRWSGFIHVTAARLSLLTGIELVKPDPHYFRVPAGYAIRDTRPPQHAAQAGTLPVVKDTN